MGLFDKKYCDVCSEKIGLLGNRKLEDGNLCKDCAKKLSPFFSERRRSTVADIKAQLDYREGNKEAVAGFRATRTLGVGTKVVLDEDAGKFVVTASNRWQDDNPDVLDFSQVTGCNLDINEERTEQKRKGKDGKEESYHPPRYVYSYDFNMLIHVNSPWFDEIRFKLNHRRIEVEAGGGRMTTMGATEIGRSNVDYRECEMLAADITEALTKMRQDVRESVAAANAPRIAQICPHCGATTTPNEQGRCEFCSSAINA